MVGNNERAGHVRERKQQETAKDQSKMHPLRVCHELLATQLGPKDPSVKEELLILALLDSELMGDQL